MTAKPKSAFNSQLADWRASHFEEMEANLAAWRAIRDNPEAADKDRTEAAKCISRALGGLAPDRTPPAPARHAPEKEEGLPVSPQVMALVDSILSGGHATDNKRTASDTTGAVR